MSGMRGPYSTPRTRYTPVDPGPPSVGSVSCPRLGEESVSLCDRNIARSRCATANSSSDGNPCNERREADPNGRLPCVNDLCSTPRQVHSQCTYVRDAKSMQRTCWRFSRGGEYAPGPRSPVELSCLTNRLAALVSAWQGVVTALVRTRVCVCVCAVVCGCVRRRACVRGCVCAHMYIPEPCSSPIAMLAVALAWYCWLPPADSCCVCTCQCRPSRECKHANFTHTCRRQYLAQGCLVLQIPMPAAVSICCAWKTPLCEAKAHSRPMISSTVCPSSVIFADLPS